MNEIERMVYRFKNFGTIRTQQDVDRFQDVIVELFDVATAYRIVAMEVQRAGGGDPTCQAEHQGHVDHAAHQVFLELQNERHSENFS